MPKTETNISLRIVLIEPPAGVLFALQKGKGELVSVVKSTGDDLMFDLTARVGDREDELPNFLGSFVQGPRGGRFVYVNSGTSAGQSNTPWTRRAKIPLKGISWDLVDRAAKSGNVLEARIAGRARDGGPACATVPLLDGWKIKRSS